jgi:hypothetical protein
MICTIHQIFWGDQSRRRLTGHVVRMDDSRGSYRVLVGRAEGKRPLVRPRCKWQEDIKM